MSTLDCRAFLYVIPTKAEVTVIDSDFHALGDVNWDGFIDIEDVELIKEAFNSRPGDPNWNPECDLNGDGIVDIFDLTRTAGNLGKTAPSYYTPFTAEVSEGKVIAVGRRGRQVLKATVFMQSTKKILFFFSVLGVLGRPIVR